MGQRQQIKLRNAFILLKCTKKTHNDCRRIRDALIENSQGYVQEAYTTNSSVDGVNWCVAASALVPVNEAKKFERRIKGTKTGGQSPVGVGDLRLLIDQR